MSHQISGSLKVDRFLKTNFHETIFQLRILLFYAIDALLDYPFLFHILSVPCKGSMDIFVKAIRSDKDKKAILVGDCLNTNQLFYSEKDSRWFWLLF